MHYILYAYMRAMQTVTWNFKLKECNSQVEMRDLSAWLKGTRYTSFKHEIANLIISKLESKYAKKF